MKYFIKPIMAFLSVLLLFSYQPDSAHAIAMAKVTIKVVDEEQKPVPEAEVQFCFHGGCLKKDVIKGETDNEGIYSVSGFSYDGVTGGTVHKDGYYYTTFHKDFVNWTFGIWTPWNKEIKVVLRPKLKPVPMYVREGWRKIPAVGKKVGFDLTRFDWVAPYGLGIVSDFIFLADCRYKDFDNKDCSLTISFSNSFDGIQSFELDMGGDFTVGSGFRTPRHAPENGYLNEIVTRRSSKDLPVYRTNDTYHFFRVRSETDENGKLKRAMYGKMKGDLRPSPQKDGLALINLFYWLNPDYTNNMEFDIDKNLFMPLPKGEYSIAIP